MVNHYKYYNRLKHAEEVIKKNTILINKQIEMKKRLKFKTDMLFARLNFVIEVARKMHEEE